MRIDSRGYPYHLRETVPADHLPAPRTRGERRKDSPSPRKRPERKDDTSLRELAEIQPELLRQVVGIFSDIDDTLSTRGKLTAEAYEALWRLREGGLQVFIVTGRPAGWCDHIGRFWPVDAVIGENGGFYFHDDGQKLCRRFIYESQQREQFRERLEILRERILREVPGTAVASDQPYREYDLAIDFCEDVAALEREDVLRVKQIFEQAGAHAKISSIHVNGWYGDFDKLSTARLCLQELYGVDLERQRGRYLFCGDSPNDEPMFEFFPVSVGVANVRPFLDLMRHRPAYVTENACGKGFVELVDALLQARGSRGQHEG